MKYKKKLRQSALVSSCLLASLTLPLGAYAQQVIDNAAGQPVLTIMPNGQIDNASGQDIGTIQANGQIDSPTGQDLGAIQPNGQIDNAGGQTIATIGSNGQIDNAAGQAIGSLQPTPLPPPTPQPQVQPQQTTPQPQAPVQQPPPQIVDSNQGTTTVYLGDNQPVTGDLVDNANGLYLDAQNGQYYKLAGKGHTERVYYSQNSEVAALEKENAALRLALSNGYHRGGTSARTQAASPTPAPIKRTDWPSCAEDGNVMLMTWNGPIALGSLSNKGEISLFKSGKVFRNVAKVTPEGHLTKDYQKYDNIRLEIDRQIISLLERFDFLARMDGEGNLWHCGALNHKNASQKPAYQLESNGHFKCRSESETSLHACGEIKKEDLALLK